MPDHYVVAPGDSPHMEGTFRYGIGVVGSPGVTAWFRSDQRAATIIATHLDEAARLRAEVDRLGSLRLLAAIEDRHVPLLRDERDDARAALARVRALLPGSAHWEHTEHDDDDPSNDCAGCWSERLRAALDGGE